MFEEDLPNGDDQSKRLLLTSRPAAMQTMFSIGILFSMAVMYDVPVDVVAIHAWLQTINVHRCK